MTVILLFIGIFQYVFMREFLFQNKAETMQSQLRSVSRDVLPNIVGGVDGEPSGVPQGGSQRGGQGGSQAGPQGGPDGAGPGRKPMFVFPDMAFAVIDNAGTFTNMSDWPGAGTPPQLAPEQYEAAKSKRMDANAEVNYTIARDAEGDEQLVVLQPIDMRGRLFGVAQLSMKTSLIMDVAVSQLIAFVSLSLLALLLGLLAFVPVLRRTLVPLSKIVRTVERIDAGNLDERFPAKQGQLELDRLAMSFNGMLERLEASFEAEKEAKEQMRRFVADASHELRTPLTSIHGFLEVLLRGAANQPDQLHRALNSMYGESERINKLVRDLLLLAKLDQAPAFERKEGELDVLLQEMEPQLRLLAGGRDVAFRLAPEARCMYDADKMKQVVLNLFHNAVQHTDPESGRIEISVGIVPDGVELTVKDNGPGIPEEHLPRVFDRFYRSESSRTRKSGGAGLGLSITRSIVDLHGGTIRAESRAGEGAAFHVTLPAPRTAAVSADG
ncbi:two-component sensor histidine kinase [Paenibacillus flagellatus]|uniref:histidine kinase n=2 Tax=Paenibacillus flagellatus TaxID=2211139 RepID=A0A2V5JXJ9_9BACL|nr:two-component sensor histidine kinase [Paenibacillus flagellatus]